MEKKRIVRKRPNLEDTEWFHILENTGITDPLEEQKRVISFSHKTGVPLTKFEEYQIEKDELKETIEDAVKYLEFINSTLNRKKKKLDKINENQRKFDEQIDSLQAHAPKSRERLNEIKYQDIKPYHVRKVLQYLKEDREIIKKKMEHYSKKLRKTQTELLKKDDQIADIKTELALMEKQAKLKSKKSGKIF